MNTFDDYEDSESSSRRFLTGMMWGIAIGAVAMLFFAPRRGVELRGQMADSMNRAGRRAMDTYTRASETVNDIAGRAANIAGQAANIAENLTERATTLTAKLNHAMSARTSPSIS